MSETLVDVCVYCERNRQQVVRAGEAEDTDDALAFYQVGEDRLLLCPACHDKYAAESAEVVESLLDGPVEFPPGVTAVEHCCPELQFQGYDDDKATSIIELARVGDIYTATCPHCGITVTSQAVDDADAE